ncbi:MAG: hypothetical protein HOK24_23240 [Desulfobacula sp.]|nr:hypothetical protein [Desulfobacula sp.]MBT5547359.1 hypothetical protein [Desulfobacula sp.]
MVQEKTYLLSQMKNRLIIDSSVLIKSLLCRLITKLINYSGNYSKRPKKVCLENPSALSVIETVKIHL